jgi:hypothetical protein
MHKGRNEQKKKTLFDRFNQAFEEASLQEKSCSIFFIDLIHFFRRLRKCMFDYDYNVSII